MFIDGVACYLHTNCVYMCVFRHGQWTNQSVVECLIFTGYDLFVAYTLFIGRYEHRTEASGTRYFWSFAMLIRCALLLMNVGVITTAPPLGQVILFLSSNATLDDCFENNNKWTTGLDFRGKDPSKSVLDGYEINFPIHHSSFNLEKYSGRVTKYAKWNDIESCKLFEQICARVFQRDCLFMERFLHALEDID